MKIKLLLLILLLSLFGSACGSTSGNNSSAAKKTATDAEFPYTKDAKPVADPEIAVIDTDYGTFKMEFYSNIAPKMVARFKELAREGVYNGTTFHRIDPKLGIIQGGSPLSKDNDPTNDGIGDSGKPDLPAEFSDIPYEKGIVGAAREPEPDTANSQFFIMTKRQPAFDKRYTVFGKVYEDPSGAVALIAGAPTVGGARPVDSIRIKTVTIQPR